MELPPHLKHLPITFVSEELVYLGESKDIDDVIRCTWKFALTHIDREKREKVTYHLTAVSTYCPTIDIIYTNCRGDKCRKNIDLAIHHWCTACHSDPSDLYEGPTRMYDFYTEMCSKVEYIRDLSYGHFSITELVEVSREMMDEETYQKDRLSLIEQEASRQKRLESEIRRLRSMMIDAYRHAGFSSQELYDSYINRT
jgi:hypothetical protein